MGDHCEIKTRTVSSQVLNFFDSFPRVYALIEKMDRFCHEITIMFAQFSFLNAYSRTPLIRTLNKRVIRIGHVTMMIREFTKPRRRRQRRRHGTKGVMSRTIAVHVRYNSWYISSPSSARRRREMTKFCVV